MKKIIILTLCLLMLCSCTVTEQGTKTKEFQNEFEKMADEFIAAVKKYDIDTVEAMMDLSKEESGYFLGLDDEGFYLYSMVGIYTENVPLYMQYAVRDAEYKFTTSSIGSDKATVNMYVSIKDGSTIIAEAFGALKNAFVTSELNGKEPPDMKKFIDEHILSAIHTDSQSKAELIVSLEFIKTDGKWLITPNSSICSLLTAELFDDPKAIINAMEAVGIDMSV
ncbi:MAG: hypothetical protein E7646_05245 [Ruminococcaceae bacterium]|nr:hypothetical protein [Oscillospiraceae bacterium]